MTFLTPRARPDPSPLAPSSALFRDDGDDEDDDVVDVSGVSSTRGVAVHSVHAPSPSSVPASGLVRSRVGW